MRKNDKESINEHDMTKKMMDVLRGGFKKLIKEEADTNTVDVLPQDAEYKDQLSKLKAVHPSGKITNFKIYPNDGNVIIDGGFLPNESPESGIKFSMSLKAGEIKIEMSGLNDLDTQVSQVLQKLEGYYDKWSDEWWEKMDNEYKAKGDEKSGY
jgi:hypothetical protein